MRLKTWFVTVALGFVASCAAAPPPPPAAPAAPTTQAVQSTNKPPISTPIKLVVYDWDGTLGDTYLQVRYIVTNAGKDAGLPELTSTDGSDPYRAVIDGSGIESMFRHIAPNGTPEQSKAFDERFKYYSDHAPPELIRLKPGTREELTLLKAHHPGIKLGILSSRPQHIVELFAKTTGIDGMFDVIVGTANSKIAEKPSPEGLFYIAQKVDVKPAEAVMVGDTPSDIRAGHAAGMWTAAFTDGMGSKKDLEAVKPDYTFDRVAGHVDRLIATSSAAVSATSH